ncbi:MAG: LysE family translocator [Thermomicrobiales bacterium]
MSVGEVLGLIVYGMVVGVVLAAPIGPINIEIVLRGVRDGFRSGWLLGLGALTADTLYATLVVSGLTPLADRPALRVPLFLAGAIMLGYVGWGSVRRAKHGDLMDTTSVSTLRPGKSYVTGFLLAAFNPMGIVYWLSVGAGLVADAVNRVGRIGAPVLVAGVFLGILCWVTVISLVAQVSRRFVTGGGMRWVTGVSGAIVIGFGLWFLWQAVIGLGAL